MATTRRSRLTLRVVALTYLAVLLILPVGLIGYRAFEHGAGAVFEALTTPEALHALYLTLLIAAIAVPLNAIFGVLCAIVLVRQRFRGRRFLDALIDLPFAVSPVVVGLALILVYGVHGWFGEWLTGTVGPIIFAVPGMVLATMFVSLPFVVREVAPVLEEVGTEQEEAAVTLGASALHVFRRVTLPSIRWALTYGVVLTTARALGEFGAVSVVSGRVLGETQTLTLHVENRFELGDMAGAYSASVLLAVIAIVTLLSMTLLGRRRQTG